MRAYLREGTVASYPVSTGKVRREIAEMLRKCGVSRQKAFNNNGLLDDSDIEKVQQYLRKRPNSSIKLIFC
jgi:hypothetical protein